MPAVKEKIFEERVRALGGRNFTESGWDKEFYFHGVRVHYMNTHGKNKKGEVPVGGPHGINYVARKMADIIGSHNLTGSDRDIRADYFKSVLKGYSTAKKLNKFKLLENTIKLLIIILGVATISFAFMTAANKITGYTIATPQAATSSMTFSIIIFLITTAIMIKIFFGKKKKF